MWITFPHECNDFRRLINVKQCLSYLMHTFPGEMCKIAVVSWFNFPSLVVQWEMLNRNQFSAFIRSVCVHFFCPSKYHLQNAISVSLWLWARPRRLSLSCTLYSCQENSLHLDRTTQLVHGARDTCVSIPEADEKNTLPISQETYLCRYKHRKIHKQTLIKNREALQNSKHLNGVGGKFGHIVLKLKILQE